MNEETKPEKRLTSAEIKKQIAEATKAEKRTTDLKETSIPLTGMVANEINASDSTPERTVPAESKPEPTSAAETKPTSNNVDLKEWAKQKGYDANTEESVLSTLRKADQVFHERQQKKRAQETQASPVPPAQQPPAPAAPYYQPAYVPQPPNQSEVVRHIAAQYNMIPEDVERLAKFNRDWFDWAMRQERDRLGKEVESIKIENQKNSVFRELSSDPVFRRPDVGMEYHKVLEEMQASDPQSFEQNPNAYKRAFEIALSNIGRRNLEGQPLQEGVTPQARNITPPSTPPRPYGQGSGGGALENENGIDPQAFANAPLEEKRRILERAGLRPAY